MLADARTTRSGGLLTRGTTAADPSRTERAVLAILLLWLLVGPRIDLPLVHRLRVEDLVFAALAVLCLRRLRSVGPLGGQGLAIGGLALAGLISAAVASARGAVDPLSSALFALRPLEYWIAFPAALLLLRAANGLWLRRIDVLLMVVTVLQTGFAVAQYYFAVPIGFSHAAYTRAAGLTVGPYELGAISAALVVYWVAHGRFTMASLASIALAASISRVSLLGAALAVAVLVVAWALRQYRRARREGWREAFRLRARDRMRFLLGVVSVGAAGVVLAFTLGLITPPAPTPVAEQAGASAAPSGGTTPGGPGVVPSGAPDDEPTGTASTSPSGSSTGDDAPGGVQVPAAPSDSLAERLATTSILGSWRAAGTLADAAPTASVTAQYSDIVYAHLNQYVNAGDAAAAGAEPSNLIRFFRWQVLLKAVDDPSKVLLGLGPSFAGPSVDGSYVRMFAEGGVLGVLAWGALVVMWFRRSPLWMTCVTISLLAGGLFIDIFYAERPMVLYWLLLALAIARTRTRASTAHPEPAGRERSNRPHDDADPLPVVSGA